MLVYIIHVQSLYAGQENSKLSASSFKFFPLEIYLNILFKFIVLNFYTFFINYF